MDEVKAERREACVQALNQFIQEHGQTEMVVCSRIRDYEALSTRLQLQGAICIQSLTLEQINQYLERAGDQLEAVKTLLQEDTALQELAKSPLTLSVMTLAYQGISVEGLPQTESVAEHRKHLLNTYIERMFKRRGANQQLPKEQTINWLSWLAQQMFKESKTIFFIEQMQPSWLSKIIEKFIYIFLIIITFIIVAILVGKLLGLTANIIRVGLFFGGFIFWLISGGYRIEPIETLKWSWAKARKSFVVAFFIASFFALIAYYIAMSFTEFLTTWKDDYIRQQEINEINQLGIALLILAAIFSLAVSFVRGLTGPGIEYKVIPNQGIYRSFKYSLFFGSIDALIASFMSTILGFPTFFWVTFGLFFGIASGGGAACIKHFILRIILYYRGYIPWNYARFLDYTTERIFLQKVGGGYIFIHRLLLEHFAQMELEQLRR